MRDYFYDKNKKELVSKIFVSYSFDNFSLFPPDSYNKIEYYTFSLINENFVNNNYSENSDLVLQSINEQKNKKYFVDINDPDCYFLTCPISLF
jgi:hypothetical protein